MPQKRKYRNKPVWWDTNERVVISQKKADSQRGGSNNRLPKHVVRFESTLEFETYLELCRMYPWQRIKLQYRVPIAQAGYLFPKGRTWRVDFAITEGLGTDRIKYFVESKGIWLPEFTYTLALFEQSNPQLFTRLRIVMKDEIPTRRRVVASLYDSNFRDNLLTLDQLKTLKQLP